MLEHHRLVTGYIQSLAEEAGAADPQELTEQILLLMAGTIVTAQVTCERSIAAHARRAAEILLRDAFD